MAVSAILSALRAKPKHAPTSLEARFFLSGTTPLEKSQNPVRDSLWRPTMPPRLGGLAADRFRQTPSSAKPRRSVFSVIVRV